MPLFFKRAALFLAPVFLYMSTIVIVDPFRYFHASDWLKMNSKDALAAGTDNALYKLVQFRNSPCENLILGDSRMYALDVNEIKKVTGDTYFNLSIFGATAREIMSTFWYATRQVRLRHVVIGMNFLLYNESVQRDRITGILPILSNPLLYFCDYNVPKSCWSLLWLRGASIKPLGQPKMSRERFWHWVLFEETVPGYLHNYQYPESYDSELSEIVAYCNSHDISVEFVIPPTHTDLQKRVKDYGLVAEETRFKNQLGRLAPTFDFEYPNRLTEDKSNFKDPMHYNAEVEKILVADIWGGGQEFVRINK